MNNILIVDYKKQISNSLLEKIIDNSNLQLLYFQDIFTLDNCGLFSKYNLTIILFLDKIETLVYICNRLKTLNSIILINNKNIHIPNTFDKYIYKELTNLSDTCIYKCLNLLINQSDLNNLDNRITDYLVTLGYNFSLLGTQYLLESLNYITKNKIFEKINLEKNIYPYLAKKHNVSINNIKCNITLATKKMTYNFEKTNISESFFCDEITTKSVIKYFILNYCEKR